MPIATPPSIPSPSPHPFIQSPQPDSTRVKTLPLSAPPTTSPIPPPQPSPIKMAATTDHRRPSPWHALSFSLSTTAGSPSSPTPTPTASGSSQTQAEPNLVKRRSSFNPVLVPLPSPGFTGQAGRKQRSSSGSPALEPWRGSSLGTGQTPPPLSSSASSQALRDWEARLSSPHSDAIRHHLVHPHHPSAGSPSPSFRPSPYHGASPGPATGLGSDVPSPSPSGSSHSSASLLYTDHATPKLAAEVDKSGFIEYKLKLLNPSPERFEKLVTQMMWRLKQGGNECIYELGLADDGTVIGLKRGEMDASLRTLELMASELGGTVIVLKEIVISVPVPAAQADEAAADSATVSATAAQALNGASAKKKDKFYAKWANRLAPSDALNVGVEGTEAGPSRRDPGTGKKMIFDLEGLEDSASEEEDEEWDEHGNQVYRPRSRRNTGLEEDSDANGSSEGHGTGTDEDVLPFVLDMDAESDSASTAPISAPEAAQDHSDAYRSRWRRRPRTRPRAPSLLTPPAQTEEERLSQLAKREVKEQKAAEKRDKRRWELLRGDGVSVAPELGSGSGSGPSVLEQGESEGFAQPGLSHVAPPALQTYPHQPARPSSLRLTTPAQDHPPPGFDIDSAPPDPEAATSIRRIREGQEDEEEHEEEEEEEEDQRMINSLLALPLDSLSLSFADVQLVPSSPYIATDPLSVPSTSFPPVQPGPTPCKSLGSSPHSTSTETELAHPDSASNSPSYIQAHSLLETLARAQVSSQLPRPTANGTDVAGRTSGANMELGMGEGPEMEMEERICVEALVVRKSQNEVEEYWGGEDDGWGLGGDMGFEGEDEVELPEYDNEREGEEVLRPETHRAAEEEDVWGFEI